MTARAFGPQDENWEAASLAAAMLRFQEPLAHQSSASTPAGLPIIGVDAYVFLPSERRVLRTEVPQFLAGLSSPALVAATTARGTFTLTLLDELRDHRWASLQHILENQRAGLLEAAPGPATDRVLLEFDAETHLFSLAAMRRWTERYAVTVGWNIRTCPEPARAEWQLNLFGGDGYRNSRGVGRT